jgi:hypothetical protein
MSAVKLIGLMLMVFGFIVSLVLSAMIMTLIGATTIMWVMWVAYMCMVVLGSVLVNLG